MIHQLLRGYIKGYTSYACTTESVWKTISEASTYIDTHIITLMHTVICSSLGTQVQKDKVTCLKQTTTPQTLYQPCSG